MFNFFKKKKKKEKRVIIGAEESFIRSDTIYSTNIPALSYNNTIILIQFTEDYFYDVMEFLSVTTLNTKLVNFSIDKETDKLDEDGYPIIESTMQYYLLIGGDFRQYAESYNSVNLSNSVLLEIKSELYKYADQDYFDTLIDDGIFNRSLFENNCITIQNVCNEYDRIDHYDKASDIINKLPSIFLGEDLLPFINIVIGDCCILSGYSFISNYYNLDLIDNNVFEKIFAGIIKEPNIDNLTNIVFTPLYKREPSNDQTINGDVDLVEISDIFKEKYDRFNALTNDDTEYIEIDEILEDYDESEENNHGDEY